MAATLFGRYNSLSRIGSANAAVLPEPAASTAPVTRLRDRVKGVQERRCNRLLKACKVLHNYFGQRCSVFG